MPRSTASAKSFCVLSRPDKCPAACAPAGRTRFSGGNSRSSTAAPSAAVVPGSGTWRRQARRQPASSCEAEKTSSSAGRQGGAWRTKRTRQRPQRPSPPHRGKGRTSPESQMACERLCPGLAAIVTDGAAGAAPHGSAWAWSLAEKRRTNMRQECLTGPVKASVAHSPAVRQLLWQKALYGLSNWPLSCIFHLRGRVRKNTPQHTFSRLFRGWYE